MSSNHIISLIVVLKHTANEILNDATIKDIVAAGGFDYIIDPFSDKNLSAAFELLAMNGKYITCGVEEQSKVDFFSIGNTDLIKLISKNLRNLGNCLGSENDLVNAMKELSGKTVIPINSYAFRDYKKFLRDSYFSKNKPFGKLVLKFK